MQFADIPSEQQIPDYHLFLIHFQKNCEVVAPFHRSNHFGLPLQVEHHIHQLKQSLAVQSEFLTVLSTLEGYLQACLLPSPDLKVH